jgi:nitrogen fixation NifU-like protein
MHNEFYGRMNDPSAAAWVTGPCGDTMEFYLVIENDVITHVRYHTDGCEFTRLCGVTLSRHIEGMALQKALGISAGDLLEELPDLPQENRHCAILAVNAFYRAVGQYWVRQANS